MLSSRFHAIVTSMPAGVPSAGVTMDERIRNLMRERGHEHLLMSVDEPDLADKIVAALHALDAEADEIRDAMGQTVARNLQLMARMGTYFEEQVARRYPQFPVRTGVLSWEDYLPPLSPALCEIARNAQRSSGGMTFLEQIFDRLQRAGAAPVVQEIRDDKFVAVTGGELLAMIAAGPRDFWPRAE